MHQLSRPEASLLAAETVTNLGHHSLYVELAPADDGSPFTFARLRALLDERIHLAPSLRRRIRHVPLELDDPWWIEDPHFDLDYHVRHLAVPGLSDPDALEQLLGRLHERPLDRSRPLWELYLIDHPDETRGVFVKVHVVITDSLGPLGPLSPVLAPASTGGDEPPRFPWRSDMVPSDSDLLIKAGWSTLRSPTRACQRVLEVAQRVPVVGQLAVLAANAGPNPHPVERARRDQPVPRSSFNRTLGAHRRVARADLSVERLRDIHHRLDARFHDVLLAVISGALRHWLVVNDELIPEPLVALTPLLVDEDGEQLGAALVPIATERHDPVQRVSDIGEAMSEIAEQLGPLSVESIRSREGVPAALAGMASKLLLTTGANLRLMPPFNVYVVNIPGGDEVAIDGHAVLRQHALCPLIDGIGLSISAISPGGELQLTMVADRDLVPDLDVLADQLAVELDLLDEVSRAGAAA